jgi:hypothetical protein
MLKVKGIFCVLEFPGRSGRYTQTAVGPNPMALSQYVKRLKLITHFKLVERYKCVELYLHSLNTPTLHGAGPTLLAFLKEVLVYFG